MPSQELALIEECTVARDVDRDGLSNLASGVLEGEVVGIKVVGFNKYASAVPGAEGSSTGHGFPMIVIVGDNRFLLVLSIECDVRFVGGDSYDFSVSAIFDINNNACRIVGRDRIYGGLNGFVISTSVLGHDDL